MELVKVVKEQNEAEEISVAPTTDSTETLQNNISASTISASIEDAEDDEDDSSPIVIEEGTETTPEADLSAEMTNAITKYNDEFTTLRNAINALNTDDLKGQFRKPIRDVSSNITASITSLIETEESKASPQKAKITKLSNKANKFITKIGNHLSKLKGPKNPNDANENVDAEKDENQNLKTKMLEHVAKLDAKTKRLITLAKLRKIKQNS